MASVRAVVGRRRWVLITLRRLFSEIDDAVARGDHAGAQAMAAEVADLLKEADALAARDGAMRSTGIRKRDR